MIKLIQNETIKILFKKKLVLISVLLLILISLFAYGESYMYKNTINRLQENTEETINFDWKSLVKQQIVDMKTRLDSPYIQKDSINSVKIRIEQLEYFLNNDINPITPSAARFTVQFMEQGIFMLLPLLIILLAADMVSGEFSNRTIKILLSREVPRWKILLSKYIVLLIMTSVVMLLAAFISIIVSKIIFNNWGFNEPIATGFKIVNGMLDSESVIKVSQWQYIILIYSLGWYVAITIGSISFMVSVLVRSTSTSIGIMMASLICGQFMQFFLSDWNIVKFFFVTNLNLPKYLTGSYQPIDDMSLIFSVVILLIWSIVSLVISFTVFTKQDVLV